MPPATEEPKTDPKDDEKTIPEKDAGGKETPKTTKPIKNRLKRQLKVINYQIRRHIITIQC